MYATQNIPFAAVWPGSVFSTCEEDPILFMKLHTDEPGEINAVQLATGRTRYFGGNPMVCLRSCSLHHNGDIVLRT